MAHWFEEIDVKSLDKAYKDVDFSSLLDKFTASPEFQSLPATYELSRNTVERQAQQALSSIIEIFQIFFKDLILTATSQSLQEFSKGAVVYLQCERFYCVHYWRFQKNENFVITRVGASFLRFGGFLRAFHEECFPNVFRRMTALQRFKNDHLSEKDIVGKMELLFTKQDELMQIQGMVTSSLEDALSGFREKGKSRDPLGLFLKKLLFYIKNMLNKNSSFLKQETDNLFGQVETSLLNKISSNNKLTAALLREKKEILRTPPVNKAHNPLKSLIMMELVTNTERVHRTTIHTGKKKTLSQSPETSCKQADSRLLDLNKQPTLKSQRSFMSDNSDSQNFSDLTKVLGERLMSNASNEDPSKKKPHNPFLSRSSKKDSPIVASGLMNSASLKNLLIADKRQEEIYNTLNDVVIMNLHNSIMELERSRITVDRYSDQLLIERRKAKEEFEKKEKEMVQKKINDDVINEKQAAAQLIAEKMLINHSPKKGDMRGFFSHPEKKSLKVYSEDKINNTFNDGSSMRKNINVADEENNSSLNIGLIEGSQKHRSFLYRFASSLLKKPHKKLLDGDSSPEKEKTNTLGNGTHQSKTRKYSWLNKVKSLITGGSSSSASSTLSTNDGKKKFPKMNIIEADLIRIDSNTKFKEDLRYVPCKENIVAVPKDILIGSNE